MPVNTLTPSSHDSHRSTIYSKIGRLIGLTVFLVAVLGLYLESINPLCDGLGSYLQRKDSFLLTRFFQFPVKDLHSLEEYAFWDHFAKEMAEVEQATHSEAGSSTPQQTNSSSPAIMPATQISLILKISMIKNELRCRYILVGPSILIDKLNNEGSYLPDALVRELFGNIIVNGDSVAFQKASSEIPEENKPATLYMDSAEITGHFFEIDLASPPKTRNLQFIANKQIEVSAEEARITSDDLETKSHSAELSRYRFRSLVRDSFTTSPVTSARLFIDANSGNQTEEEPLSRLMERSGLLNLPILGRLAETLLASAPYILLLILIKRHLPADDVKIYQTVVGLLLALSLGVSLLSSIRLGPSEMTFVGRWGQSFIKRATGISNDIHPPYSLAQLLVTLFAGLLWSLLVRRAKANGMQDIGLPWKRSRIALTIATIVTIATVSGWVFWLSSAPSTPAFVFALWLSAIIALLFFWILWELFSGGRALLGAFTGIAVIVAVSIGEDLPRYVDSTPSYRFLLRSIAVTIVLAFGIPLIIAFFRLTAALVQSMEIERLLRHRWVLWWMAVAVCLPTTWLVNVAQIWSGAVWTLSYRLIDIFLFAVILLLLRILKEPYAKDAWPKLAPIAIDTGIVLALISFYSSTSIWFYFPIPLILGYVLLKSFLLVSPGMPAISKTILEKWDTITQNALQLRRLERTSALMRKGLEKKLASGEITWPEYQDRLEPLSRALESQRGEAMVNDRPAAPLLFSYGTTESEWDSGRAGAVYSLCFALPWILLSLRDLLNSHGGEPYILLSFLSSASMIVGRWTLYGFFFGYFYAYIRGKNGFQKALSFWFTLVLPSVLAFLLSSSIDRAHLAALVFWTAQVFVHCVVLGLFVGELQSLRRAGLGWRQLVEFHNLTSLSAWGSSVLVALGAAVTAALSTSLQSLITLGLKYVGVLPQGTIPGK